MKKLLAVALISAPGLLFAQNGSFKLKGKVGALNQPAKAYLRYSYNDKHILDSAELNGGVFELKGNIDYPVAATVIISHDGKTLQQLKRQDKLNLYLEPSEMVLSAADSVSKSQVEGSQLNAENVELKQKLKPFDQAYSRLYTAYRNATEEQKKSDAFEKDMNQRADTVQEQRKAAELAFIKGHPNSLVSISAIEDIGGDIPDANVIQPLYNSLSAGLKNSAPGKIYGKHLDKLLVTAVGSHAPEITLPDTAGKIVKLSSFKGKYVLVDFWASWCAPCRAENPAVLKAYGKYRSKGFEILGVSLDKESAKSSWIKAIHDDKLTWTQVSDLKYWNSAVAETYSVRAIPQNFLLDPSGKIIAKNLRGEELEKKLGEILGVM